MSRPEPITDAVRWGEGTTRPPAIIATHPTGHDAAIACLVAAGWQITAEQPTGTHLAERQHA